MKPQLSILRTAPFPHKTPMKLLISILFVSMACSVCYSAPPKTKDQFLAAVRAAYESKDVKHVAALTWWAGASEEDRKMLEGIDSMTLKNVQPIEAVTLEPLNPAQTFDDMVRNGKRYGITFPPIGMVKVKRKADNTPSPSETLRPYAVIDGGYYIVTSKITDLGWKGPQDKCFNVIVTGLIEDHVTIHIKYNASGVELEKEETLPAAGSQPSGNMTPNGGGGRGSVCDAFFAQYIEEVTVTNNTDDVALELREGMNEPFYKSEKLKGKGQIHYKRNN